MRVWSPLAVRAAETRALAPRRGSVRGLRVGVLDNSKPNADVLLHRVAALLVEQHGAASVRSWQKPGSSKPALMIEEIADQVDVVLTGSAD
jgi:hypothetical protein